MKFLVPVESLLHAPRSQQFGEDIVTIANIDDSECYKYETPAELNQDVIDYMVWFVPQIRKENRNKLS